MWEIETVTYPKARKEYHCQASDCINQCGLCERDFEPKDWLTIKAAEKENYKILKGTKYVKISGKWEGEFSVFRARLDLNDICNKEQLYPDE